MYFISSKKYRIGDYYTYASKLSFLELNSLEEAINYYLNDTIYQESPFYLYEITFKSNFGYNDWLATGTINKIYNDEAIKKLALLI
jgi:hypothetical protein